MTPKLPDRDFFTSVSIGEFPDYKKVSKFGSASVGASVEPVCRSGFYRMPTTATSLEVLSDSGGDNIAGAGAQKVTLIGLDDLFDEVVMEVEMDGTTPVAIPTALRRLYRWYVSESGTYADQTVNSHLGELTIREAGGGATWSMITDSPFAESRSQIGAYTIARNFTGFIIGADIFVDSTKACDIWFLARRQADVTSAPVSAMEVLFHGIGISGHVPYQPKFMSDPLLGPTDILFVAKTNSGLGDVTVNFEILLEAN